MIIKVSKKSLVGQIKRQFNSEYPFLKIEFIISPHVTTGRHPVIAADETRLENIQPIMKEGAIVMNQTITVSELGSFFHNHSLDVQVFRRSDNLWLETTITDAWTLEKQNTHGREISEFKHASNAARNYNRGIAGDAC